MESRIRRRPPLLLSSPASLLYAVSALWLAVPRTTMAFEMSCANARVPVESSVDFCSLVTWRAAVMYTHINDSDFSSFGTLFSDADQDHIARRQYHDLVVNAEVSAACKRSLQRFVCASVFPECPGEGIEVSYVPVCKGLCREAETECGLPLSCDFFQPKDCTAAVEEGFFVLKDDQGPYEPLPYLYAGLLVIWTAIACMWLYQTFVRYRHGGSRLGRLLSCVPIAKVSMMMLSLAFWSTCVKWGYCSFWMGVSLINCQLMYETFSLIGFVLIAKGWCVTRPTFHPSEWRNLVILMCSFYLASSSLLLIRRVILSSVVFWLCTGLLYGSAYTYVIFNVQERLRSIRRQMRRALVETPGDTERLDLMVLKHWMYQTLSTLLTIFCLTELFFCLLPIVHHVDITGLPQFLRVILSTASELDARLWLTLVIHEVIEILIMFLVGFIFRPRLVSSTFYYIEMEATDTEARQLRPPPLYLIPVPSRDYGDGSDITVPRAMLSPTDVTYTRAVHARHGYQPAGDHHHYHSSRAGTTTTTTTTTNAGATLTRRPQHGGGGAGARETGTTASQGIGGGTSGLHSSPPLPSSSSSSSPPPLAAAHGAGALMDEQLSPLLLAGGGVVVGGGEGADHGGLAKSQAGQYGGMMNMNRYHANHFLVVAQPFGSYAVAVLDKHHHHHHHHHAR